ncbi:MAG: thioredoxin family protein, partial [Anaerolineales bacterium]|nr:thioredoxin family protein [Anaerolineales bacterium]
MLTLLNQFSYVFLAAGLLLGLAAWLALTGLSRRKLSVFGVTIIALAMIWVWLRPGTGLTPNTVPADLVIRESRTPVLIEFYSEYCIGCLAAETTLDALEAELKGKISVVRLDMSSPTGRRLSAQLNAHFTPTFILFDAEGREIWRAVGELNAAAVRDAISGAHGES